MENADAILDAGNRVEKLELGEQLRPDALLSLKAV